jgi:pilus assembly protein CpaE
MNQNIALIFDSLHTRDAWLNRPITPPDTSISTHAGGVRQLAAVMQKEQPDVVILEMPQTDEAAFAQIEAATLRMPRALVLLVSPDHDLQTLKRAMRAGVRDVLPAPMDGQTVQAAIERLTEARAVSAHGRDSLGVVHAFMPAKGGSGCTFLATNLAHGLSVAGKRVLLIDLNLYFGEAVTYLSDRKAEASVVDLARQSRRLDAALLDASVLKTHERLHVLAAPDLPYQLEAVTPDTVAAVIALARNSYDFVLLDMGRTMDPATVKALDLAERIHLVMGQTLPALHDAKRMTQVFDGLGYAAEKIELVINGYSKGNPIALGDVENATRLKVGRTLPTSEPAVMACINQGLPLAQLAPRDPVSRALQEWVQALAPAAAKTERARWFPTFARGF